MSDGAGIVCFPVIILAAVLSARRWPRSMRWASRCLAVANGLVLLSIIATGWIQRPATVVAAHRWLPHVLFVFDWSAIPFALGETLARPRMRPIVIAARVSGLVMLLGVVFLASITGYLGPSHASLDAMNFRRFQVLHYWLWPALAVALVIWWCHGLAGADSAD
jgi:hypothetical protein